MCPVCRSMLTSAELLGGRCGSCDARFAGSDLGFSAPPAAPNPYAAPPESNYVAATVVQSTGSPEYEQARKETPQILFGLAGLGGLVAAILLGIAFFGGQALPVQMVAMAIEIGFFALIFCFLGVWSLYQPFPAAIMGLVIYVLIFAASLALNPLNAARGVIIRLIIMGVLGKNILALSKGPGHA